MEDVETDGEGDVVFGCCDRRRPVPISPLIVFEEGEVRRTDIYKQKLTKVGVVSARRVGQMPCPPPRVVDFSTSSDQSSAFRITWERGDSGAKRDLLNDLEWD